MKICSVCKLTKPLNEFHRQVAAKDGIYPRCKVCDKEAGRQWRLRNPERFRESSYNRHIKWNYGITRDAYDLMLEAQDGVCKICGNKDKNRLCIDHCHKTNKIRSLLCNRCNRVIGMLDHDPELIRKAASYLDTH